MGAGWCLRTTRVAVFAAVCVVLAALGHVLMSGEGLPWWVLLSGAAVVGAVGWAFGAHERRRRTVAGLTVGVQACLHFAFELAQSGNRPATAAAPEGTQSLRQWAEQFLCGAAPTPTRTARAHDIAVAAGLHPTDHTASHGADGPAATGHDMTHLAGSSS